MARHAPRVCAALAALALAGGLASASPAPQRELRVATTTHVRDSGLLAELLPDFQARTGIAVQVTALDLRGALELARRGDADLVIAHDPDAEQALVEEGALVARRPFVERVAASAGKAGAPPRREVISVLLVPPDRFAPGRIAADEARALFTFLVAPATLERIVGQRAGASGLVFRPLP